MVDRRPYIFQPIHDRMGMDEAVLIWPLNPLKSYALEGYMHLCTFSKDWLRVAEKAVHTI